MPKKILLIGIILFCLNTLGLAAEKTITHRTPMFENAKVKVWRTTLYPQQPLKMHRHEHDRVLIAFDEGRLDIVNEQGKTETLNLKAQHAYYLTKNIPNELHIDANRSKHPIRVMIVELKE